MTQRMIFVNLPVEDLGVSRAFYTGLGFEIDERWSDPNAAAVSISEQIVVMLLTRQRFADFVTGPIGDASAATSVINALSTGSRDEVAELKRRALASGGSAAGIPQDHGFMISESFADPDGHLWEVIWMDPAAAAAGPPDMPA